MNTLKNSFAQIENLKEESNNTFGAKLAKNPLNAVTDIPFSETKKTLGEGIKVLQGKQIEKKSFPQRLAQWSTSLLEVATVGVGGEIKKGVSMTGEELLKKYGYKKALELALDKTAGKDGTKVMSEILGEDATKKVSEDIVNKSLKEKLDEIASRTATKREMTKEASKLVAKEVAKKVGKSLVSKTAREAMVLGAGFNMGSAISNGESDTSTIIKEGAKGALFGLGMEKAFGGAIKTSKYIGGAESEASASLNTLREKLGRKTTTKEYFGARKRAYTPQTVRDFNDALDSVEKRVLSTRAKAENIAKEKINKANAKYSGKKILGGTETTKRDYAIKRLRAEKDLIAKLKGEKRAIPQTTRKDLVARVEEKKPADYNRIFKSFGAEDFNIDTARKNYVKKMNKVMPLAYKGDKEALKTASKLIDDWKQIEPYYKETLADKVFEKKTTEKLSKLSKAKDIRTLLTAKQSLNEERTPKLSEKARNKKEVYRENLNELIDKKKFKKVAWNKDVSSLSDKEISKEISSLSPKEEEGKLKDKTISKIGMKRFKELTREKAKRALEKEKNKPAVKKVEKVSKKVSEKKAVKTSEEKKRLEKKKGVEKDIKDVKDRQDKMITELASERKDLEESLRGGELTQIGRGHPGYEEYGGATNLRRYSEHSKEYRDYFKENGHKPPLKWYKEKIKEEIESGESPASGEYNAMTNYLKSLGKDLETLPSKEKPAKVELLPSISDLGKGKENFVKRMQRLAKEKKALKFKTEKPLSDKELVSLDEIMEENPDMEFSIMSGDTAITSRDDINIVRNAKKLAEKPYSLTQLIYDTKDLFSGYAKRIGRAIDFKVGLVQVPKVGKGKQIVGQYHEPFDVVRTLKEGDFSTVVHEFTHFATTEKAGFKVDSISRNAKAEVMAYFGSNIREGYAKAMELLATDPEKATRALPNLIRELKEAHPDLFSVIREAHNNLGRLQSLNPQDALRGFQTPLEKNVVGIIKSLREKGVKETIDLKKGKFAGVLKYLGSLAGKENAIAGMFDEETTKRINKQIVGGTVSPYNAGFVNENELISRVGRKKAKEIIVKLKRNWKLPFDWKSFNQITIEGGNSLYDEIKAKTGLTGKKNYQYMMDKVGNWMLMKHAQERSSLVGAFTDVEPRNVKELKLAKTKEISMAKDTMEKIEKENPWAKEQGEKYFKWWKDSTKSIVDLYSDVFTPEEKTVLLQKLYKNYFPVVRRGKGIGIFRKAKGGVGLIRPAMEGFTKKMEAIRVDLSKRRGKAMLVKALKDLKKSGADVGTFEDITKPASKEQIKNWKRLEQINMMTEEELSNLRRSEITKGLKGLKDIYHEGKFLDNGIMYLVENGRRKVYEIDPHFSAMFKSTSNNIWGALTSWGAERDLYLEKYLRNGGTKEGAIITKGLSYLTAPMLKSANVARAGIIFVPKFMLNNFVRDPFTMMLRYKGNDLLEIKPTDSKAAKKLKYIANNIYMPYAMGGSFALDVLDRITPGNFTKERGIRKAMVDMAFNLDKMDVNIYAGEGAGTSAGGAYDIRMLKGFWKEKATYIFDRTFGASEAASRKATMGRVLKEFVDKGGDLENLNPQLAEDLAQIGNEITINWRSKGKLSQYAKTAPFGRATLTATAQDVRFVLENPSQVAIRTAAILLPATIIAYGINHRSSGTTAVWNQIGTKTKQNYWLLILGKDKKGRYRIVKMAKPKEVSMVATQAFENTLDNFSRINPKTGYNFNNALFDSVTNGGSNLLQNGLGLDYISQMNPVVLGAVEQGLNKKLYWGGNVVSPTYQKEEATSQQNNYTGIIAKVLGKTMDWSPMIVDNYIKDIGGTLGNTFEAGTSIQGGGSLASGAGAVAGNPSKVVKNALTIQQPTGYYSRSVKNFYSEFDKLSKKYNSRDNYKLSDAVKIKKYYSAYLGVKSQLSGKYKQLKKVNASKILNDKQKKDRATKINDQILSIVENFNKKSETRNEYLRTGIKLRRK